MASIKNNNKTSDKKAVSNNSKKRTSYSDGKFHKQISAKKKLEIMAYARDLYLQLNEKAEKELSNNTISKMVSQKFHMGFSDRTIGIWAAEEGWDFLLQTAKNLGVEKALDEKFNTEENIKAAKSNEVADIYKSESIKYQSSTNLIIKALNHLSIVNPAALVDILPTLTNISASSFNNLQKLNGGGNGDKYDDIFEAFKSI